MFRRRLMAQAGALLLGADLQLPTAAWGGVTTGKIAQLHVSNAGNLPFRVFLEGLPVLCTGGMAEGYLDDTDYADVGQHSRCRIGYLVLQ